MPRPSGSALRTAGRYSRWTGDVGTALFAAAWLDVDARYPILDIVQGGARATLAAVLSIAALQPSEIAFVDQRLPLSRLDQQNAEGSTYLVAWEDDRPVGHAHIAWVGTHLGVPEIQDVFVLPARRRQGIGAQLTDAAEQETRARGWESISLSVSQDGNVAARSLYAKLGYVDAGVDPVRVSGVITVRGRPLEVDDTLVYLTKSL